MDIIIICLIILFIIGTFATIIPSARTRAISKCYRYALDRGWHPIEAATAKFKDLSPHKILFYKVLPKATSIEHIQTKLEQYKIVDFFSLRESRVYFSCKNLIPSPDFIQLLDELNKQIEINE